MHRPTISFRINRARLDTKFVAGADYPYGDLAAVGDEDFGELNWQYPMLYW